MKWLSSLKQLFSGFNLDKLLDNLPGPLALVLQVDSKNWLQLGGNTQGNPGHRIDKDRLKDIGVGIGEGRQGTHKGPHHHSKEGMQRGMGKEDRVGGSIDHGLEVLWSRGESEISCWQSFCSVFWLLLF